MNSTSNGSGSFARFRAAMDKRCGSCFGRPSVNVVVATVICLVQVGLCHIITLATETTSGIIFWTWFVTFAGKLAEFLCDNFLKLHPDKEVQDHLVNAVTRIDNTLVQHDVRILVLEKPSPPKPAASVSECTK
jgi:hypothetical protein